MNSSSLLVHLLSVKLIVVLFLYRNCCTIIKKEIKFLITGLI